jgi:RNA-directed DNA polymerase
LIGELNSFLSGWVTYFRYAAMRSQLRDMDSWIRRKLRCVRLKECKRSRAIVDLLQSGGVPVREARQTSSSGKGWWRLSGREAANAAMSKDWFERLGLVCLQQRFEKLNQK